MAESGSLPTGFGELEVLAVGTVLLVEGERGRAWVEQGPGGLSDPGHSYGADKQRSPNPTPLCLHPWGFCWVHLWDAGCRLGVEREKPGKSQGVRNICPEHDQEPGSGLFLSLQLGENLTHSLEIPLRIS